MKIIKQIVLEIPEKIEKITLDDFYDTHTLLSKIIVKSLEWEYRIVKTDEYHFQLMHATCHFLVKYTEYKGTIKEYLKNLLNKGYKVYIGE